MKINDAERQSNLVLTPGYLTSTSSSFAHPTNMFKFAIKLVLIAMFTDILQGYIVLFAIELIKNTKILSETLDKSSFSILYYVLVTCYTDML
jgi:hypothetical protein